MLACKAMANGIKMLRHRATITQLTLGKKLKYCIYARYEPDDSMVDLNATAKWEYYAYCRHYYVILVDSCCPILGFYASVA